jgi:hypothetical protein
MLDDLLLAYHDLKDLYDDDVESKIETIDDVESIKTIDYTNNSSSSSNSTSIKKKKQKKCNSSDHHHRIHLQRQQPPGKWRDDLTDDNNDDHDDDHDDDDDDDNSVNDRNYDDEWKPTSFNNKISIKKNKKKSTSTMTTPKKRYRCHNDDNKVKVKTGKEGEISWIRSSSSISRSRSKKRLDHASLKNLMIGLESPSLFSPRAIMLKNEVFLDSLVDVDVDDDVDVGGVTSVEHPTTPQTSPSYPDITTVIVEKKIHNNDKNNNDDEQLLDHDLGEEEEEEEQLLLMAGKRIEVQWDMNDGTTDWFAGTIRSISNDRSEAVLLYDDGDCCLVDMNDDDMEWRCCQGVVVVAPVAAPAAVDTMIESKTAPSESSFLSPPSTVISGMDVPISPIVVKKKKKKEKQPSSSSLLSSSLSSSSSLPLRDTTMTVKGVGGEASSTLKSDTRKVKITEPRKLPRTRGVLYSRDKKGGFYCVDGCEGDLGYGVHSVPGGRVKNSEVYSNYVDSQKEPNQESRERKSSSLPLRDTTMTVILNKQKPKEKQNGEKRRRKVPDLFVAETSQDHNSKKNKNKYGNHNNIINSNFTYKERTRTRIGNDDDNDDGDHRDHRRDHRYRSNILKKLQPFNQPGKNQTYNITGVDYKNEKAAPGRGRKRNFESNNNQEQDQQKQKQTIPRLELKQVQNETTLVVVIKKKKKRKRTQPPAFAHITTGRRPLPPPIKIPKAKGIAYSTYDRPLVANEEIML